MKKSSKQKAKSLKLAKSAKAVKAVKAKPISKTQKVKKNGEKDISWDTAKVVKKIKKTLHLKGGKKLLSKAQEEELKKLYKSGITTVKELCKKFMISASTFYNYVKR